jgi:hypothetical protein
MRTHPRLTRDQVVYDEYSHPSSWTVVVDRPFIVDPDDYDDHEVYVALRFASTTKEAIDAALREAWLSRPNEERGRLDEWRFVALFRGHHRLEGINRLEEVR